MHKEEHKGVGLRLEAQIIDWIAVVVISLASLYVAWRLSIYPVVYVDDLLRSVGGYELTFASFWFYCALVGLPYHVFLEGATGRTLGKTIVGIRVIKEDGAPCGFRAALVRNVLRIVDVIPPIPLPYLLGACLIHYAWHRTVFAHAWITPTWIRLLWSNYLRFGSILIR